MSQRKDFSFPIFLAHFIIKEEKVWNCKNVPVTRSLTVCYTVLLWLLTVSDSLSVTIQPSNKRLT